MLALEIIFNILFWPSFVISCYYAILAIVGMLFHKQKYPIVEDKEKFCIFVPCHNEEAVIGATVENLAKINYNKDLFDIYFIADNCSDNTADAIRSSISSLGMENFHVLERNVPDLDKRGKPHAMRWGIELLEKDNAFYNKYDQFMILDADNFVDADILKHVNSQYLSYKENKRPVMVQTYLDSKNYNNFVARGYYMSYRVSNGFINFPKHKLGLVPGIGGTGFAIDTKFLKSIGGFNATSLTEDLEIQTVATIKGKTIAYNHNARIYDEKPTSLRASIIQKTRWEQGYWYCFFKYGWRLLLGIFNPKQFKNIFRRIDNLIQLSSCYFYTSSLILLVFNFVLMCCGISFTHSKLINIISIVASILLIVLVPISSLYDGTKEEKKKTLLMFVPNYFCFMISNAVYIYASIVGLFKCGNQKVWRKTVHKVTSRQTDNEGPVMAETKSILDEENVKLTRENDLNNIDNSKTIEKIEEKKDQYITKTGDNDEKN